MYRGTRTNLKKFPKMSYNNRDWIDIATCPVCTQNKPVEAYSVREIIHMAKHVKNPQPLVIPAN